MKGERAEGRTTDGASIREHLGKVEPFARSAGHFVAGDGMVQWRPRAGSFHPFAECVIAEPRHDLVCFQVR